MRLYVHVYISRNIWWSVIIEYLTLKANVYRFQSARNLEGCTLYLRCMWGEPMWFDTGVYWRIISSIPYLDCEMSHDLKWNSYKNTEQLKNPNPGYSRFQSSAPYISGVFNTRQNMRESCLNFAVKKTTLNITVRALNEQNNTYIHLDTDTIVTIVFVQKAKYGW